MGKNKKKGKAGSSKAKTATREPTFTAEDLLNKVDEYLDTFEYELALKFCEKAIALEPGSLKVIETSACVYAETGDAEASKKYFSKAVELNPDKGHEKYMYLGQMSAGEEAKKWYLKGIEIMKKELEEGESEEEVGASSLMSRGPASKTDVSNAFCALAEIYMTDCCFEEDAEKQCETYCKEALEMDPKNVDAYIVNANLLMTLERKEEAKDLLKQCFEILKIQAPKADEVLESENEGMENDTMEVKADDCNVENGAGSNLNGASGNEVLPPYPSRVTLAKLLTETGEHEKADIILNTLIGDDDEDIEVWYMYGWSCYLQEEFSDAVFYLEKATELYEKLGCNDEELFSHVTEILENCRSKISATNNGMDVEE